MWSGQPILAEDNLSWLSLRRLSLQHATFNIFKTHYHSFSLYTEALNASTKLYPLSRKFIRKGTCKKTTTVSVVRVERAWHSAAKLGRGAQTHTADSM